MTEEPSIPPIQEIPPIQVDVTNTTPAEMPASRYPFGWLFFWVLFIFLIGSQAFSYLTRKPEGTAHLTQQEVSLRMAVTMKKAVPAGQTDQLGPILNDLRKLRSKNKSAARMYLVAAFEGRHALVDSDFTFLGEKKVDNAYRRLYQAKSLTAAEAAAINTEIQGKDFSSKLARAHSKQKADLPGARDGLVEDWKIPAIGLLALAGAAVCVIGLASWVGYLSMRVNGNLPPLGHPAGILTGGMADRYAGRAAATLALLFLGWPLLLHLILPKETPAWTGFVQGTGMIAIVFLLAKIPIAGKTISLRDVGLRSENLGKDIAWGAAAFCANIPLVLIMGMIGSFIFKMLPPAEHPITGELQDLHDPVKIASIFFLAAIVAPITEEIIFRGHIFPALTRILKGPLAGAIVSSLLFAAIHPTGIPAWLALATVGAMNCALAYQRRSLVPSIVLHGIHNASLLALTLFLT